MESGTRFGPYEILEQLGAGGMGQVWLAQDTQLGRKVALKVLPAQFASDPERLARFEQEAKALAALNHPNIAQVFGLEQAEAPVIVMELVDGQDLSQLLAGRQLPLDEVLPIARQIAEALGAAHEAGIVHRDLKPANVVVRPDGVVKVLDFGLARTVAGASGSASGLAESPTIMSPAMTATGMIMGTAAYMAPEQAKGRPVDRRADVWAFGCVLYEMLVGRRPFGGDDIAEVMASVIRDTADLDALPEDTPVSIRRLLTRCLKKDPADRLDSMAAVRLEIEDAEIAAPFQTGRAMASRNRPLQLLTAGSTGLIVGALLWSVLSPDTAAQSTAAGGVTPVHRSQISLPEGQSFARGDSVAISRDGSMLALAIGQGGQPRLYLRRLESLEMEAIENTEGAEYPFFSADGEQLGFFADGVLKKISLRGGVSDVTALCEAPVSAGGTWAADGWIYFIYGESRLARVSENGGEPEQLGEAGDIFRVDALPDDHGILLTLNDPSSPTIRKDTAIIAVLSSDGTTVTPVMKGGYNARYLSSGHLVFMRSGGLFAMPFDLERLQVVQPAVSVQPRVWTDSVWGRARYDVSRDGTLVFVPGGDFARTVPTWVDLETGAEEPLPVPDDIYNNFDLSPDGTKLAIQSASGSQDQVYVYDSVRGAFERLTLDGANVYPVWSHDGLEVFFSSTRRGGYRLYRKPVDGSAPASSLLTDDQEDLFGTDRNWPISVTPDGQFLLIMTWAHADRGGDMWKVPLDGSGGPEAVLTTSANEIIPQISPNGKWLAYLTDRAGPYRIMVRPFPDVERREWVISGADGYDPRWSADGDALFYRQGWGLLMRTPVGGANDITPGIAQQLLEIDFHDSAGSSFVVSPDGRRVLVNKPVEGSRLDETPITLVTGWATEVAQLAGPGRE